MSSTPAADKATEPERDAEFGIESIYISRDAALWGRWFVSSNGVPLPVQFVRFDLTTRAQSAAVEGLMAVIAELAVSTFPFGTKCWCRAVDACENQKQCVNARAALAAVEEKEKA